MVQSHFILQCLLLGICGLLAGLSTTVVDAFQILPIMNTKPTRVTNNLKPLFVSATMDWVTTTTTTPTTRVATPATIETSNPVNMIESIPELLQFMEHGNNKMEVSSTPSSTSSSELTVVNYYASYCKTCQRVGIKFQKMARENPTVTFAKAESKLFQPGAATTLKTLGVTKFPFVQIFRQGKCIASFSTGPSHMFDMKVGKKLRDYLNKSDEEWKIVEEERAEEIQDHSVARHKLLSLGQQLGP